MKELLEKRARYFEAKARELGLDFFPINYEVVPEEVMLEIITYSGLPVKYSHWSFGQSYDVSKIDHEMGMSKVYELVINSDPAYAFLLDTNSDTANSMIISHVIGHVFCFKHNYIYQDTDRDMVKHSAERALRIDDYINKYGLEKVEHILDIALAFEKNIDFHKGQNRTPYAKRKKILRRNVINEFDDLFGQAKPGFSEIIVNESFPPEQEYDLLWFFANYGNLDDWQKDILNIVRQESFYFYPQHLTKICQEAIAVYTHAKLMNLAEKEFLSDHEHLEFCKLHEKVVQPGKNHLNINPYFLGYTILTNIEKRWDEKFKNGESKITGHQKVLEAVTKEDDISLVKSYLTQEIVDDLKMFCYKVIKKNDDQIMEIVSTDVEDIAEDLASKLYHYRAPSIYISKASSEGIELIHDSTEVGTLDPAHVEKWMGYIHEIWGGVIDVETIDDEGGPMHYTYDEEGFSHHGNNPEPEKKVSKK